MFKSEVDYRLAKWLLMSMERDGVITAEEMRLVLIRIAEEIKPLFFELEDIGSEVSCDG